MVLNVTSIRGKPGKFSFLKVTSSSSTNSRITSDDFPILVWLLFVARCIHHISKSFSMSNERLRNSATANGFDHRFKAVDGVTGTWSTDLGGYDLCMNGSCSVACPIQFITYKYRSEEI